MAKLIDVETVRKRGVLHDLDEVKAQISRSLDSATAHLESILLTSFAQEAKVDTFWIDPEEQPYTDQFITLRLASGFVDGSETFELRTAINLVDVSLTDAINSDYILPKYEQGLVMITGTDIIRPLLRPHVLTGQVFMEATYTAGFLTEVTEFGPVYTGVPSWLQEAAIIAALDIYDAAANCDGKTKIKKSFNFMTLIEQHIRFFPQAISPLI